MNNLIARCNELEVEFDEGWNTQRNTIESGRNRLEIPPAHAMQVVGGTRDDQTALLLSHGKEVFRTLPPSHGT